MNEPVTEAGRMLVTRLVGLQRDYYHITEAVLVIEAEARADLAKRIEERVTALVGIDPLDDGHQHVLREDILALVREEATR